MPVVAGTKSSDRDACRIVVANLEYCLSCTGYDPSQCKPEVAGVMRCCGRFWVRPGRGLLTPRWRTWACWLALHVLISTDVSLGTDAPAW